MNTSTLETNEIVSPIASVTFTITDEDRLRDVIDNMIDDPSSGGFQGIITKLMEEFNNSPEDQFAQYFTLMYKLCKKHNWGDPFSYARSREIIIANTLGHTIGDTYSGADGYDNNGKYEYKSTIAKDINGTYNGISVQDDETAQKKYINDEKIGNYDTHYFARFDNGEIAEMWSVPGVVVARELMPKIIKQFHAKKKGTAKDPRIGVTFTKKQIKTFGARIL